MRVAVWFSNYGLPNNKFELPYIAQSPVLLKKIEYETDQDVLQEINRVIEESNIRGYDIGKSLYFQMPFFCNPIEYISQWCWDAITDYFIVKKFNTPLATSIDNVNIWLVDCFSVIEQELNNISVYEKVKNGS